MIRKSDSKKKFYYIQCGDWDASTIASSHKEACLSVVSQAIDMFGKKTELSEVIVCCDCDNILNDDENAIQGFLSATIMEELSYEY